MRGALLVSTVLAVPCAAVAQKCEPPAQAAAVGFNTQTLGGLALGKNWFLVCDGAASQSADGTITIPGGACNHYNAQIYTRDQQFGGGGYFEATLSFQNTPAGWSSTVDGWPAFWAISDASGPHVETDWFEFMTAGASKKFDFGLQDWGSSDSKSITWAGSAGYGVNTAANLPANFDPSQPHTYGGLWVPATATSKGYAKMFVDGKQVGPTYQWSRGKGPWSSIDAHRLKVILGTGSANPMTVWDAQVWQASAANDVGLTSSSLIPNASCVHGLLPSGAR